MHGIVYHPDNKFILAWLCKTFNVSSCSRDDDTWEPFLQNRKMHCGKRILAPSSNPFKQNFYERDEMNAK